MNKLVKTLLIPLALALPVRALYASPWVNSTLVGMEGYVEVEPGVYAAAAMSPAERQRALDGLHAARRRIADAFGEPVARPVTILAPDTSAARRFGLADGVPGTAFIAPLGTQVVLDMAVFSIDVTAHELTHAEIAQRLGFWTRMRKLPVWFDEGVAVQLDWREKYLVDCAAVGAARIDAVRSLDTAAAFWRGGRPEIVAHYQAAKCAAAGVLATHPPRTLYASLTRLREGAAFADVFGFGIK